MVSNCENNVRTLLLSFITVCAFRTQSGASSGEISVENRLYTTNPLAAFSLNLTGSKAQNLLNQSNPSINLSTAFSNRPNSTIQALNKLDVNIFKPSLLTQIDESVQNHQNHSQNSGWNTPLEHNLHKPNKGNFNKVKQNKNPARRAIQENFDGYLSDNQEKQKLQNQRHRKKHKTQNRQWLYPERNSNNKLKSQLIQDNIEDNNQMKTNKTLKQSEHSLLDRTLNKRYRRREKTHTSQTKQKREKDSISESTPQFEQTQRGKQSQQQHDKDQQIAKSKQKQQYQQHRDVTEQRSYQQHQQNNEHNQHVQISEHRQHDEAQKSQQYEVQLMPMPQRQRNQQLQQNRTQKQMQKNFKQLRNKKKQQLDHSEAQQLPHFEVQQLQHSEAKQLHDATLQLQHDEAQQIPDDEAQQQKSKNSKQLRNKKKKQHDATQLLQYEESQQYNSTQQNEVTMLSEGQVFVISRGQHLELKCEFEAPVFDMFDNPVVWKKHQKHEISQINIMGNIFEPFLETNRFEVGFTNLSPKFCLTLNIENLTAEDSGNYTCEVRGRKSVVLQSITHFLFVRVPVRSLEIKEISLVNFESPLKSDTTFTSSVRHQDSDDPIISAVHPAVVSALSEIVFVENRPRALACLARGGYPVPQLNLYLGDREVTDRFTIFSTATLTGFKGLRKIETETERLSEGLTVDATHDGQTLRCVSMVPGQSPNSTSAVVVVHYGPVISCSSRTARLGEEKIFISCEIKARPGVTSLFWIIDVNGTTLSGGEVSNEYWSVVMDRGGGVLESKLYMRKALEESFRTYTIVAENNVAVSSQLVHLHKKFIPTPPPHRSITHPASLSRGGGGSDRRGSRHQTEHTYFRSSAGTSAANPGTSLTSPTCLFISTVILFHQTLRSYLRRIVLSHLI